VAWPMPLVAPVTRHVVPSTGTIPSLLMEYDCHGP
jgi:hypothetical protein